jgi:hypothetical protein
VGDDVVGGRSGLSELGKPGRKRMLYDMGNWELLLMSFKFVSPVVISKII